MTTTTHPFSRFSPRRGRTALAAGAAVILVGAAAALANTGDPGGYASPERLQSGYGPAGPPPAPVVTVGGRDYGLAALLQLGHGPAGPPQAR